MIQYFYHCKIMEDDVVIKEASGVAELVDTDRLHQNLKELVAEFHGFDPEQLFFINITRL